jgi:hypothetical protein
MTNKFEIDSLDAMSAVNILQQLASADPDYAQILHKIPGSSLPSLSPTQQEELATTALQILAENPKRAQVIDKLAQAKTGSRFDGGISSVAFLVGVAVLMRTHVKYQRRSDGTWNFTVEHKPAGSKLLSDLMNKVSSLLPIGN